MRSPKSAALRSLQRRLERLEKGRRSDEPVLLQMPDGRTEMLWGNDEYVMDLLSRAVAGERTRETELIAQSISSIEPGGGQLVDLVRALLNGPIQST